MKFFADAMPDSSNHITEKKRLRRGANAQGLENASARHRLDAEICERFLNTFTPDTSKSMSFFWPLARECDTRAIAEACHKAGMATTLPVIRTDAHGLLFRRWTPDSAMIRTSFGTLQPLDDAEELQPDIMLVPLVMVDLHGTRLGRGAGHYDATLGPLRRLKNIMAIGIAYDWQVSEDPLPREAHDERLDGLITPSRAIVFA